MDEGYQRKLEAGIYANILRSNKMFSEKKDNEGAEIFYIVAKECYELLQKPVPKILEALNYLEKILDLPLTESKFVQAQTECQSGIKINCTEGVFSI